MGHRKFKANYIFTGNDLLNANHILITDNNGVIENIVDEKDAGENIETFDGILSPGFVNCHCHLELSHLKNVIESKTGLVDFLIKVISSRAAGEEEKVMAMLSADEEMYDNGIVAVGDICNTTDSISIKQKSKIAYHNFIEALGFTEDAKQRLENYIGIYNVFCKTGFENQTSVVPHAPYTVSTSMFNYINKYSAGKIISIHNQETLAENELYNTNTGDFLRLYSYLNLNTTHFKPYNKSSLQSYLPFLNQAEKILLIHNTFTQQDDIDFAFEQIKKNNQQLFWCLCANANLYIENKLPPVILFKQNKCNIVLGTDSYSSNWSLSILDEIKTLQKNFPLLTTTDLLSWATLNGAKALNMDDKLGCFEKGKQPGVLIINNIFNKKITDASAAIRIL